MVHNFAPDPVVTSVIQSIPKNNRKSLSDSQNYRGIALASPLIKLFELVILDQHRDILACSDMQFGFKPGLSTTQCTFVLEDIIDHYNNKGSDVFVMLLDASRAFDLVEYVHLFKILMDKGLCPTVTKLLLTLHLEHLVCVKWLDFISEPFQPSNGVKQGSVISPILFTLYVDKLLERLEKSGLGCRTGHLYAGGLSYADDITLASPSLTALQSMLDICEEFGVEYSVTFNPSKCQLLYYPSSPNNDKIKINFNGQEIESQDDAIHLGNLIGPRDPCKSNRVNKTVGDFYGRVNTMFSQFGHCSPYLRYRMFETFCTSYYGVELFNFTDGCADKLYTGWRKSVRRVLGLHRQTHCNLLPYIANTIPIEIKLHRRFMNFFHRSVQSDNKILRSVSIRCLNGHTRFSRNLKFISYMYNIQPISLLQSARRPFLKFERDHDLQYTGNLIKNLINYSGDVTLAGEDRENIKFMIDDLCIT